MINRQHVFQTLHFSEANREKRAMIDFMNGFCVHFIKIFLKKLRKIKKKASNFHEIRLLFLYDVLLI